MVSLLQACGLIASRGEGRRLVQQGGVTLNGEKAGSIDDKVTAEALKEGVKIRKGKKVYHRAVME